MSGASDENGFALLIARFIEAKRVLNFARSGLRTTRYELLRFARWCEERGLEKPSEVSRASLEGYQRWLFHYRKKNGQPLKINTQMTRLVVVRSFFTWLVKNELLPHNPASELDLPRVPDSLPTGVLTLEEVETLIGEADLTTTVGLRDRAIMETLFSTGIRREELLALQVRDLNLSEGTLWIRKAKGGSVRTVPIGNRAMRWLEKYLMEARPELLVGRDNGIMFLNYRGEPLSLIGLTHRIGEYVTAAGIEKRGACHLFRHTMATLMLEGGADIRHIQEMLGHRRLSSTQLYTKVSLKHLKEVHERTHPGAKMEKNTDVNALDW